ncbi:MAG: hypothetical protein EOR11_19990 [Mesorhizobium sp.]|uniref:hypothetical protein n=1 Tax=Mesorhizobium sp. TaxID=1871066 RepID=UPI000FE56F75|nr:hypothetical protein [Mesorhizobium sp.]RWP84743.1 MAG: hypothetical protein EOR11_19990 [Mesorhizobium sp.]
MDIRAVNFVATAIGWLVLVVGVIALLAVGIDATKSLLSDAAKFFLVVGLVGFGILAVLYFCSLDWFRDKDSNEAWHEERQRAADQCRDRQIERLEEELRQTRYALNTAKPQEKPRVRTKPKQ